MLLVQTLALTSTLVAGEAPQLPVAASPLRAHLEAGLSGAVVVRIDYPRPGERAEIEQWLAGRALASPTAGHLRQLERQLLQLGRYRVARCRVQASALTCALSTARTVRRVRLEGVPFRVLKRELKKRIFIRPGQRVDSAEGGQQRVQRQRQRIESYLRRQGIFGARVEIRAEPVDGDPRQADLWVRIHGGGTVRVRRVEVQGAAELDADEIAGRFRPSPWETFDLVWLRQRAEALERELRADGQHPEATVSARPAIDAARRVVDLRVKVHLGPRLQVTWRGVPPELVEALGARLGFARVGAVDEVEIARARDDLRHFLQTRGYARAVVHSQQRRDGEGRLHLRFDVELGRAYRLREVRIDTRDVGLGRRLRSSLALHSRAWGRGGSRDLDLWLTRFTPGWLSDWLGLASVGRLVDRQIEADRRRIEQRLEGLGYPEASVSARVERVDDAGLLLRFRVEPGPRFVLSGVRCRGNAQVDCADIVAVLSQRPGGPFLVDAFDLERARILSLYTQRGFPYAQVQVLTEFDPQGRPALSVVVQEGPRARLQSLLIDGNVDTARDVIVRELGVSPGEPLEPAALVEGQRRLRRSAIFRRVRGRYLGLADKKSRLAYQLQLEEARSLTLDTALSFSTAKLLGLEGELRERNLGGRMVDAQVQGRFGLFVGRQSTLRSSLRWPRVWATPLTLSLGGGYDLLDLPGQQLSFWDNLRFDSSMLRTHRVDAKLRADLALSSALSLGLAYELSYNLVRVVEAGTYDFGLAWKQLSEPARFGDETLRQAIRVGALGARAQYLRLDNPFNPRQGMQGSLGVKLGARALGGQGDFALASTSLQLYSSWSALTLAASFRGVAAALLDPRASLADKRLIPDRDLLIAGGDRSVRGHDTASIGVPSVVLDGLGQPLLDEQGQVLRTQRPGLLGAVVNLESRLALGQVWIGEVQLAAFADLAVVADELPRLERLQADLTKAMQQRSMGVGVGVGLRFVTPVGPLALDLAVDPFRMPNLRPHVQFGYAF